MVLYPAALDLPHALVELVTMVIVTREGDRRCKLPPHQRALLALVYLRKLELWVPAEELDEFNAHIVGTIQLVHEFRREPDGTTP